MDSKGAGGADEEKAGLGVHYVVAIVAVLGIVVMGSQIMLLVPAGWGGAVAVVTFIAAAWAGRFIVRRARR